MEFKYLAFAAIITTMILSACDININTGSGEDSKDTSKTNIITIEVAMMTKQSLTTKLPQIIQIAIVKI